MAGAIILLGGGPEDPFADLAAGGYLAYEALTAEGAAEGGFQYLQESWRLKRGQAALARQKANLLPYIIAAPKFY